MVFANLHRFITVTQNGKTMDNEMEATLIRVEGKYTAINNLEYPCWIEMPKPLYKVIKDLTYPIVYDYADSIYPIIVDDKEVSVFRIGGTN